MQVFGAHETTAAPTEVDRILNAELQYRQVLVGTGDYELAAQDWREWRNQFLEESSIPLQELNILEAIAKVSVDRFMLEMYDMGVL